MSGWTLYWILILDNLKAASTSLFIVTCFVILITMTTWAANQAEWDSDDNEEYTKTRQRYTNKWCMRWLLFWFPCWFLCLGSMVFVPNTKQAAVIAILPPLVNSEAVQGEAKELYDLAKSWLQEQAGVEDQPKDDPTP